MNILDNIRNFIAKRNVSKITSFADRRFYNLSKIKSIHVLYYFNEPYNIDADEQYKKINMVIDKLRELGIDTYFTCYVKDSKVEAKRLNMSVITIEDVHYWSYKPKDKIYNEFMNEECDTLLNLSPVTCWPIEYLAQYSKSKFKIAVKREVQGAKYDFLFSPSEDTEYPYGVFEQIISYLQKINS